MTPGVARSPHLHSLEHSSLESTVQVEKVTVFLILLHNEIILLILRQHNWNYQDFFLNAT